MSIWRDLAGGLMELFFPPDETCAVCDRTAGTGLMFCRDCLRRLPALVPPVCERCGRLLRLAAEGGICSTCASEEHYFSRARAAYLYEGPIRAYLHEVKFRRSFRLAQALAGLLAVFAREESAWRHCSVVVPVPLHRRKEAERGFNQAEIMAAAVGKAIHRPICPGALARTRRTESQSRLDRRERRENVRDAFCAAEPAAVADRTVLLVDDILTTGYTASECARVLLRSGAKRVEVLTLANGCLDDEWLERQNT